MGDFINYFILKTFCKDNNHKIKLYMVFRIVLLIQLLKKNVCIEDLWEAIKEVSEFILRLTDGDFGVHFGL